jgi:hypothetical protein
LHRVWPSPNAETIRILTLPTAPWPSHMAVPPFGRPAALLREPSSWQPPPLPAHRPLPVDPSIPP